MTCPHCGDATCELGYMCPRNKVRFAHEPQRPGEGSYIDPTAVMRRPHLCRIGKFTNIDAGFLCTSSLDVGDYCHIAPGVIVIGGERGKLTMGHFSTLGAGSRVVTASETYDGLYGPTIPIQCRTVESRPVTIEPMAAVTTGCIILPGVTLGMGCVIGAGSVVTTSTEPWGVYVGVPARKVSERPRERCVDAAFRMGYDFR